MRTFKLLKQFFIPKKNIVGKAKRAGIFPKEKFQNKFFEIDYLANSQRTPAIEDVFAGKIDGIIVRNFLTRKTREKVKTKISNWQYSTTLPFHHGVNIGRDLFSAKDDLELYTKEVNRHIEGLDRLFETDYIALINNLFRRLSLLEVNPAPRGDKHTYSPSTIRVINPNVGIGFQEHVGNEFMKYMSQCKEIRDHVFDEDQLSFFMVIQKPEAGGELTLFDLVWKDSPKYLFEDEGTNKKGRERADYLSKFKNIQIELNEGDLIIFDGGRIWHKVNEVKGDTQRITMGGFMGLSRNGDGLYYWV